MKSTMQQNTFQTIVCHNAITLLKSHFQSGVIYAFNLL